MGALALVVLSSVGTKAQGTITYHSDGLSLSGTVPLECDPMSEDDPNDLVSAIASENLQTSDIRRIDWKALMRH